MSKRILFISHMANRSGAPLTLLATIKVLKLQIPNLVCDILVLQDGELMSDFAQIGNVIEGWNRKTIPAKIGRKLKIKVAKRHYLCAAKTNRYDLIYVNTVASLRVASEINAVCRAPMILHLHESDSLQRQYGVTTEQLAECSAVIAVSQFAAYALMNNYDYPIEKICICHPFSELAKKLLKDDTILPKHRQEKFIVGLSGYGYWIKAIDKLPLLVYTLKNKYPTCNCQFIWVGELNEEMSSLVTFDLQKYGIEKDVVFTGSVENPNAYYSQFDVFVLLSREDSFPLVTLENAALAKPIICFDGCSGAVDWVRNGAGVVVPYMDIERVADAIYSYYMVASSCEKDGLYARKMVQKLYTNDADMQVIVRKIMELFNK